MAEETEVQKPSLERDETDAAKAALDEAASGPDEVLIEASAVVEDGPLSQSLAGEADSLLEEGAAEDSTGDVGHQPGLNAGDSGFGTRSRQQSAGLPDAAVEALLSAAETANRIAQGAEELGARLQSRGSILAKATDRASALHMRTLLGFAVAMAFALVIFAFMSVQLSSRIAALNATVVAVGDRVVRLSVGLQDLESLRRGLAQLTEAQRGIAESQITLGAAMEEAMVQNAALPELIPAQMAPQLRADLEAGVEVVRRQVEGLSQTVGIQNESLADYARSLEALQRRIQELDQRSASIGRLEQDLQALVTLTRERYLEALRALAVEEKPALPPMLQYPPAAPSPIGGEEGS